MDGAGVGGTCLAAVLEENERAPALAFSGSAWTVLEEALAWRQCWKRKEKTPALALGAVRG